MIRASLLLLLALAGCGRAPSAETDLDALDRELANAAVPARDPALTAALADQIMVDPTLAQGSNANAVRPPPRPDPGSTPPIDIARIADPTNPATLRHAPAARDCPDCATRRGALTPATLAARQPAPSLGRADCAARIGYSAGWANRLPAALPLYPDARVAEAAGSNGGGCSLRVVSFASGAAVDRVIDFYYTRATAAGYSAEHRADGAEHLLAGTRGDAAYAVYVSPRAGGGTSVDLVANAGT